MMKRSSTIPEGSAPDALVQTTYDSIKEAILSNRLRPGNKLTHQGLAEQLGVSRTPVRESLERLYQEGYVTRIANRGYYVAEITAQEVRELYQTREGLELYSLKAVMAAGIPAAEMEKLLEINARYGALCMKDLSRERLLIDREFHLTLAQQSNNSYLYRTLAAIFDRLILKRKVEGYHALRGMKPYEDHIRILAAIEKGSQKTAVRLLHEHIEGACIRFVQYLEV